MVAPSGSVIRVREAWCTFPSPGDGKEIGGNDSCSRKAAGSEEAVAPGAHVSSHST